MSDKHTKGNWTVRIHEDGERTIECETEDGVYMPSVAKVTTIYRIEPGDAPVLSSYKRRVEESAANASLMAAAPQLFEALRAILEIGKRDLSNPKYDAYFDEARSALAKATSGVL